jgi:hypothetical protein
MNNQLLYILVILLILYFLNLYLNNSLSEAFDDPLSPTPKTKTPPVPFDPNEDRYKLLSKYLILVLRKYNAQEDLYKLTNGHAQVFQSPRLDHLNHQIAEFKKRIKSNPETLQFFTDNLDLII